MSEQTPASEAGKQPDRSSVGPKKRQRKPMQVQRYPAIVRRIKLNDPMAQQVFEHNFPILNIALGSIMALRANQDSKAETAIHTAEQMFLTIIEERLKTIDTERARLRTQMDEQGIDAQIDAGDTKEFDARLSTPWSAKCLDLYLRLDAALLDLRILWLANVIDSSQMRRDTRALMTVVAHTVRQVQSAVARARTEASRDKPKSAAEAPRKGNGAENAEAVPTEPTEVPAAVNTEGLDPVLFTSVDELNLAARTATTLKSEGILLIGDLIRCTDEGLLNLPNIGQGSLSSIQDALAVRGLTLGAQIENWPAHGTAGGEASQATGA
ncbi:MAG: DNA-directed RNA polymerase subunit alpha C-terminal domain-containing protein [Acidiferrobacterales bacterium]